MEDNFIMEPSVVGGMVIISATPDGVTITGSQGPHGDVWSLEFGVQDGQVFEKSRDRFPGRVAQEALSSGTNWQ